MPSLQIFCDKNCQFYKCITKTQFGSNNLKLLNWLLSIAKILYRLKICSINRIFSIDRIFSIVTIFTIDRIPSIDIFFSICIIFWKKENTQKNIEPHTLLPGPSMAVRPPEEQSSHYLLIDILWLIEIFLSIRNRHISIPNINIIFLLKPYTLSMQRVEKKSIIEEILSIIHMVIINIIISINTKKSITI